MNYSFLADIESFISANTSFGFFGNSIILSSIAGNMYFIKRVDKDRKEKIELKSLLKECEPLLKKIINGKNFETSDIHDAKRIRDEVIKLYYPKK